MIHVVDHERVDPAAGAGGGDAGEPAGGVFGEIHWEIGNDQDTKRLGDFVIATTPPYYMFDRGLWPSHLRFASPISPDELSERTIVAGHGYPPDTPGIESVFFAMGAGITKGASLEGLRAIG